MSKKQAALYATLALLGVVIIGYIVPVPGLMVMAVFGFMWWLLYEGFKG